MKKKICILFYKENETILAWALTPGCKTWNVLTTIADLFTDTRYVTLNTNYRHNAASWYFTVVVLIITTKTAKLISLHTKLLSHIVVIYL